MTPVELSSDMTPRRVAIHQPNYAPWCGYFAKMASCDVFVFLDDAQMPGGQSYVYRTAIRKGQIETTWLSIPKHAGLNTAINGVTFADPVWRRKHLLCLRQYYSRTRQFAAVFSMLESLYSFETESLADFNVNLVMGIAGYLGVKPEFRRSSEMKVEGDSDSRLIELTRAFGGTCYVSGKGGSSYQDPDKFAVAGLTLEVKNYHQVPYQQQYPLFIPGLSILDALFNIDTDAKRLLHYE